MSRLLDASKWVVGLVLATALGCLPEKGEPLDHPRIRVWVHDVDGQAGKELLTIDPRGRFVLEDWVASGHASWKVHACDGQLPTELVAPAFARFDAAQFDGPDRSYGVDESGRGPQTLLLYVRLRSGGHPHDRAEFEQLLAAYAPLRAEAVRLCPDHPRRE